MARKTPYQKIGYNKRMSKAEQGEVVEAVIVKDNDGKKARKKIERKRVFQDLIAPILIDIALLILGICLLVWADKVTSFISITIGIVFAIYGLYNFIDYYRSKEENRHISSIITGLALIIAGIFLCVQTDFIKESISFIVGIFIIIISLIRLQDALTYRSYGPNYRWPMLLSIIGIAAGVLCVIGKIMISNVFIQILGVMLIIFAISNIANSILIDKIKKH